MEKLTAPEFARLTQLLAQGDSLTEAEATERAALEAKIVERAEDETPPAGDDSETPPAPESEGETPGDGAGSTDDDDSTDDTPEPSGEDEPAPESDDLDLNAKAFTSLTVGGKFKALVGSRAKILTKLAAAEATIKTQTAAILTLTTAKAKAESALKTAQASLTTAQSRVTTLEAEAKDLNTAVSDELAGIGVSQADIVAPSGDAPKTGVEAAYEAMQNAKTPEESGRAHAALRAAEKKAKAAKALAHSGSN